MAGEKAGNNGVRQLIGGQWIWFVVVLSFALFAGTFRYGFVWDDLPLLKQPSPLHNLNNAHRFFMGSVTTGLDFLHYTPYYRPVFSLVLALEYAISGGNPIVFHLFNVLFHAIVTFLVMLLAHRLYQSRAIALLAGLVFAVHPVHSEAVAYVAGCNEQLCAIGYLGALLCYISFRENGSYWKLVVSLLFFAISLLSKEMSITLPIIIIIYEFVFRRSVSMKALFLWLLPFFFLLGGYILVRQNVLAGHNVWSSPPLSIRIPTSVTLVAEYWKLLLYPLDLKTVYDTTIRWYFFQIAVIAPFMFLLALAGVALFCLRRFPVVAFGILWVFVTLLPVSGLPTFLVPTLMANRYLYLPSVGFVLAVSGAAYYLYNRYSCRRIMLACGVGTILFLALLTLRDLPVWQDFGSLSSRMILDAPNHHIGYHCLGTWHSENRRFFEMTAAYSHSIELSLLKQQEAARGFLSIGDAGEAEAEIRQSLSSGFVTAESYAILAEALADQGKLDAATDAILLAIESAQGVERYRSLFARIDNEKKRGYSPKL